MTFDWVTAATIFVGYCTLDWLYTIYTLSIVAHRKMLAANVGVVLYALSAYGVVNYVDDWRYVMPMCAGGWLGTFLSVWHQQLKGR
ncbi:hypothetical protein LCGC14_1682780 [marine sediment metagenome]|uniref:Uncharacterized protein n=1 Tax=marine sediment metagenome TaxID=412755 RepID=A0A0F9HN82_9ZZZZ